MRGFLVTLNDGSVFDEDSILQRLSIYNLDKERPWIALKKYLLLRSLKLVSLQLKFDHQTVFLPQNSKCYFYSKKVEAFFGGKDDQRLYYGVGATENSSDEVVITWFDGENSTLEQRKIDETSEAFIINR